MMPENDILVGSAGIASRDHFEHVDDIALWVPQGLFCPARSASSQLMASVLTALAGKTVLDLGTGTGFLAIIAAERGAQLVIATDIDPRAAMAARRNVTLNRFDHKITVLLTDLFTGLRPRQFDTIVANLPLRPFPHIGPPLGRILNTPPSLVDNDHKLLKHLFDHGAPYLRRGGNMLFVVAAFSQKADILAYAAHCQWHIETLKSHNEYEICNATR